MRNDEEQRAMGSGQDAIGGGESGHSDRRRTHHRRAFKPRYLPEIRPTAFNYPVDIFGRWRGSKYSFITRYRSGFPENAGEEFDLAFTRLDHIEDSGAEHRFNVMWHRHTGQWWRLHGNVSLAQALRLIETDGLLHPL